MEGLRFRTIQCARCGEKTVAKGPSQKYCPACATASVRERNRKYRERAASLGEGELTTGKCSYCGKNFSYIYEGKRRTKCDACRKYDDKHMSRIIREPTRTEIERELRRRRIDEIQRAAQAAGMSYGRYVAMMEMQKGA